MNHFTLAKMRTNRKVCLGQSPLKEGYGEEGIHKQPVTFQRQAEMKCEKTSLEKEKCLGYGATSSES